MQYNRIIKGELSFTRRDKYTAWSVRLYAGTVENIMQESRWNGHEMESRTDKSSDKSKMYSHRLDPSKVVNRTGHVAQP